MLCSCSGRLAKASALFAIVTGVRFHLLTPFRWGMVVVLSLSANRAFSGTGFARKTAFRREKNEEKIFGPQETTKTAQQVTDPPGGLYSITS